ncbi:MAG: 50S ribosomal protein L32 [Kiritimatiellae bacterium]|jgi:large subunit ribosomal protein L32|nr:50S ribosomal protein L32 [Kiritimatiellia bacterium]
MASPKNRVSKMRKRQRVASLEKPILAEVATCPACGAPVRAHRACPKCGTYRGRKVVAVSAE